MLGEAGARSRACEVALVRKYVQQYGVLAGLFSMGWRADS